MAEDLKSTLDKAKAGRGNKAFFFAYVGGKRKDGKGDGELEVVPTFKSFKKEDLADAVQAASSFVQGKCWGDPEGKILYISGKGINVGVVDKINKTANKVAGKPYEFALASEQEEERQTKLEAAAVAAQGKTKGEDGNPQAVGGTAGRGVVGWKAARVEARDRLRKLEALLAKTKHPLAGETVGMIEGVLKKFDVDIADKAGVEKLKAHLNSDRDIADLESVQANGESFGIRATLLKALDGLAAQLPK
jgi:hypothetical protein